MFAVLKRVRLRWSPAANSGVLRTRSVSSSAEESSAVRHVTGKTAATKKVLTDFGFTDHECEQILESFSSRGPIRSRPLLEAVTFWGSLQLDSGDLYRLLVDNTDLLYVTQEQGIRAYQVLAKNFTKNQIKKVFISAPRVVHRNPRLIEEVVKFLETEKRITKEEIARSGALVHSLSHVRLRFEFLERAGLYTIPQKWAEMVDDANLDAILNSSDKHFATKVAGLSVDEYDAFKELLRNEDDAPSEELEFGLVHG